MRAGIPWENYNPFELASWKGYTGALVTQIILTLVGLGGFSVIVLWVAYAIVTGRNLKQRLTDPAEIVEDADPAEAVA